MEGYVLRFPPSLLSIQVMSFDRGSPLTAPLLCCSLRLRTEYDLFRERLESHLPFMDGQAAGI